MRTPKYNRIRVLLAERDRTATWLADELGLTKAAVARWCTNKSQPRVPTLYDIARILGVSVHDLLEKEDPRNKEE